MYNIGKRTTAGDCGMIIDAHTHVFPDAIAGRSIETLEKIGNEKAVTGGTADDLLGAMKAAGVDLSVVLPVVTKPRQFESINSFAAGLCRRPGLISLGGIHPACDDIDRRLDFIASLGLKGVKLHPDYQETDITDEGYIKILVGCRERGLAVFIHAGVDPASPGHVHCPPDLSADVVKAVTKEKPFIVLAHMGGAKQIDLVERCLTGLPVYFDTSFVLDGTEKERIADVIRSHGIGKILFGTDSPWRSAKQYIGIINSILPDPEERDAVFSKNCAGLLGV